MRLATCLFSFTLESLYNASPHIRIDKTPAVIHSSDIYWLLSSVNVIKFDS